MFVNIYHFSEEHALSISRIGRLPGRNVSRPHYLPFDMASHLKRMESSVSVREKRILIGIDSEVSIFSVIRLTNRVGARDHVIKTSPVRLTPVRRKCFWADVVGRTVV